MALLVEHCKDDLEPQAYEQLKKRYSMTVYEQKQAKMNREKEKLEREKKKLALKERELKLKEQTAQSYQQQTDLSVQRKERENLVDELAKLRRAPRTKENLARIEQLREKIKELDTDKT